MNVDEQVVKWAENKMRERGYDSYLDNPDFRVVGASFGRASEGSCDTCYYEYPAILIDLEKKVHHKDGSTSWRNWKYSPIDIEIYDHNLDLIQFYAELDEVE